jgi:hypothetical protein
MTDYPSAARQAATAQGIDPNIFVNQIQQESGFNPRATSPAGAQGIAQFMPATAAGMGINPWDALQALAGAAALDASNLKKYNGDYRKMLAAYNAGGGTVDKAINRNGAAWLSAMPSETQQYVSKIMSGSSASTSGTATTAAGAAAPATSSGGILDQIKQWGEYIAIFFIAIILIIVGFLLLAEKQTIAAAKTVAKAAVIA